MAENSPAFQRWDRGTGVPSPEGTVEEHEFNSAFGTQSSIHPHPALKRRAIFKRPFGTQTRPPYGTCSSNPCGIGHSCPPLRSGQRQSGQECPRSNKNEWRQVHAVFCFAWRSSLAV